jgi:hypothetical protein
MTQDIFSIAFSIVCSLCMGGFVWGIIKEKVTRLEKDCVELSEKLEKFQDDFVRLSHFDDVIQQLREDVKQILTILTNKQSEA